MLNKQVSTSEYCEGGMYQKMMIGKDDEGFRVLLPDGDPDLGNTMFGDAYDTLASDDGGTHYRRVSQRFYSRSDGFIC